MAILDSVREFEERRGQFLDDKIGEGADDENFQGDMEEFNRLLGEDAPQKGPDGMPISAAPPEPPPVPNMPGIEGQPDQRWMDENVPFTDLIGGNPEIQKKIQEREMTQDAQRLEWQARHLASLGVKEQDMPPDVQAFIRAARDPEAAMQGLQAQ